MLMLPIKMIANDGNGDFSVLYADDSIGVLCREEMLYALRKGAMNEAEATAFKYSDAIGGVFEVS